MAFFDSRNQRATFLILLLGFGLLYALMPYASGLIGGLVLMVVFAPLHGWLSRHLPPRVSAAVLVVVALLVVVVPVLSFAGLLLDQAQSIATGVVRGPLLDKISAFEIRGVPIGPRLAGLGEKIVGWLGSSAFSFLGTATRIGLNLTIALFVLYYLLLSSTEVWAAVKPYIPFSSESADLLRDRFRDVTISTVIGTGVIAVIQGYSSASGSG